MRAVTTGKKNVPRMPTLSLDDAKAINNNDVDRRINNFATRAFREVADRDYLTARLACRADLIPQFLWSAQQAIEKYLKCILLLNRIPAKSVRHDIAKALTLVAQLPFKVELCERSKKFIAHVAAYGEFRYLDVSTFAVGHVLVSLDLAVWELRRYCQVLNVFGKKLIPIEQQMLDTALKEIRLSDSRPRHTFRVPGGYLEEVLAKPKHPAREALVRQNPCYGVRARKTIKSRDVMQAFNSPLYLFPEMLDELLQYVFIPSAHVEGWREHLRTIQANPLQRP
jgi:HEPN domain-containing protein